MNLMLKIAALSCAGLTVFGASGCKVTECDQTTADGGTTKKENCLQVETTVEYQDMNKRTGEQAWTTGRSISITNRNGKLTVAPGAAGDERVLFSGIAFTRETDNAEGAQKATNHLGMMTPPSFSGGDFISLVAPGGGVDGYHLTVWIPPDFNASLSLTNDNGTTELTGVEGTLSTTVTSHAIKASNLKRTINLHAKVGDIDAWGVPSGTGNVIRADVGDVNTTIGAANLTITAKSDSGVVTFPMGWMSAVAGDKRSGSATLGDGSSTLDVSTGLGNLNFFAQ